MSTDRDATRLVRSWLEQGVTALPDRVLDAVLDRLPATPQRRSGWPAWRFAHMNMLARSAIAAAAVLIIVVVGYRLLPGSDSGVRVTPAPTTVPTVVPTATAGAGAGASPIRDGALAPGSYYVAPYGTTIRVVMTVSSGWSGFGRAFLLPDGGPGAPGGMAFGVPEVGALYSDPCNGTAGDVPIGTSVADLVDALAAQTAYGVSAATDITIDGAAGKRVDLQLPSDVDFSKCTNDGGDPAASAAGLGGFFVWQSAQPGAANVSAQGPGNRFHLMILDVSGTRVVIMTHDYAGTSEANRARLQEVVDSIQIE